MRWMRAAAVATALMVNMGAMSGLTGCSSDDSSQAAQQHASTVVGATGGTVTTQDGTGVTVPAGAVPANVTITVDATPSAPTPSQGTAVGTPYTFGPEGQQFSVPVTVTLAFDPSSLPAGKTANDVVIFTAPAGTTSYVPLGTSVVDSTHAAAQTTHFSTFVCVIPLEPIVGEDSGAPIDDASEATDSSPQQGDDATSADDGATTATDAGAIPDGSDQGDSTVDKDSGSNQEDSGSTGPSDATIGGNDGSDAVDASSPSDGGGSNQQDGGSTGPSDATIGGNDGGGGVADASPPTDSGGSGPSDATTGPSDASGPSDSGAACNVNGALGASIIPLQQFGGLNMNQSGPGLATLAYAESVFCGPGAFESETDAGVTTVGWQNQAMNVDYDQNGLLVSLMMRAGPGTVTFKSRANGAYGTGHGYVIGVGTLTKDGSPLVIDWTGTPATAINEIFDGMMATFAPTFPVDVDCVASGTCGVNPSNPDAGVTNSFFGIRTLSFYAGMTGNTSVPAYVYTFFNGELPVPDAGAFPGLPGNGGMVIPSGCAQQGSGNTGGTCASPNAALCGKHAGTTAVTCEDWPQFGYTATCCPTDAGP